MTEKFPELLQFKPYADALATLARAEKARGEAQAEHDKLAAGIPSVPSATQRALAWLNGGNTALKKADVSQEQIDAAKADLAMMTEAVRIATEHAQTARKTAVANALQDRLPEHKTLVANACDSLDSAVEAIDAVAVMLNEARRMSGGEGVNPLHEVAPTATFVGQLRHHAGEFRRNVRHYIEG
jgi:hypothetical protein